MLGGKIVDAVIGGGMGARAVQGLKEAGIKVYVSKAGTVDQAIKNFDKRALEKLAVEGSCKGHGCR